MRGPAVVESYLRPLNRSRRLPSFTNVDIPHRGIGRTLVGRLLIVDILLIDIPTHSQSFDIGLAIARFNVKDGSVTIQYNTNELRSVHRKERP